MLTFYQKIRELPLIYEGEPDKRKLYDILMDKENLVLSYLCYEVTVEGGEGASGAEDQNDGEQDLDMVQAFGSNISNIAITDDLPSANLKEKHLNFIDADNAEVTPEGIIYDGRIRLEDPSADRDDISFRTLLDKKIITETGDDIGKIDDVIINTETHKIAGVKVKEGLIERLMDDGLKFVPVGNIKDWHHNQVKVIGEPHSYVVTNMNELE